MRIKVREANSRLYDAVLVGVVHGEGAERLEAKVKVYGIGASSYDEAEQLAFRAAEHKTADEGYGHINIWSSFVTEAGSGEEGPRKDFDADLEWVVDLR